MYRLLYARNKSIYRTDLLALLSDPAVHALVANARGVPGTRVYEIVRAEFVTELGCMDIREVLDERADVPSDFVAMSRSDGVLCSLDPFPEGAQGNRFALMQLTNSLRGAGHNPEFLPVLFVLAAKGIPQSEVLPTWEIELQVASHMFAAQRGPVAAINPRSAGDLSAVVLNLLDAVDDARSRRAARESESSPPFFIRRPEIDVEYDWGPAPPSSDRLLEAWQCCRAPILADLVVAVSYANRAIRPSHFSHEWWIETCRCARPMDVPNLLDTLFCWVRKPDAQERHRVSPTETPLREHRKQVLERLEGLCWLSESPIVSGRLGRLMHDLSRYRNADTWAAIHRALERHSDPLSSERLMRLVIDVSAIRPPLNHRADIDVSASQLWGATHRRFSAGLPNRLKILPQHQDEWNELVERIRRPLPRAEDMEAVAADPQNDDVRREVAERMRERGDPRGELILLQLKKATDSLSPDEHEREQALKRTYAWDWLGPLADVVDVENSVFEKGYPVSLTVWTPNTRALNDVIGKPEWATVRELRWGGDPCWEEEAPDAALVEHPIMRSLERVTTKMPEDPIELEALRRVAWAR